MAGIPPPINSSQPWADHDIKVILLHFIAKKSEIGDAGNFKKKTYVAVAEAIPSKARTWEQVKTKWHALKTNYHAIQTYQDTSGVHWDTPENEQDIGRGANIMTDAKARVWQTMIQTKKNHPMKAFCNRGWRWLSYIKMIMPIADDEASKPRSSTALSVPLAHSKKSRLTSLEKGKRKARSSSNHSTTHSLSSKTPSTSQRVEKVTPAVTLVELHGSIKDMTQEVVHLVQECDDGLSVMEKAALIVFFGDHHKEVDMYIALQEKELQQAVIKQWVGNF
ncbi:hypothetical protein L208DRAFT_1375888 [Tricholoma matsutake]|nr:hypothetical protein L208DRAFT_1375888 [Tricholoma matsutake 945]